MSSANPQEDITKVKDVFDNTILNINTLTEEDMQKILIESTIKAQLCIHPILVSVDEIEKGELVFVGEKTQASSITPTQTIEVQPSMHMVIYHRKDNMPSHINTKVPTITIVKKERTLVQIGKESSPAPIPQAQGREEIKEKEKDRTKDLVLTTKQEEVIAIHTLVTLLDTTTPTPSQALHRPSTKAIPLQASRPSPSTSKVDQVTSYGDINLNEVIVLPKYDLTTITIE